MATTIRIVTGHELMFAQASFWSEIWTGMIVAAQCRASIVLGE